MKILCPIPIFGRFPLAKITVSRLIKQNVTPIIIGHEEEAKKLAAELDVEFVNAENSPLGQKWNAGFFACKRYNPDAVLFMGSSDWCSDYHLSNARKYINNHCIVGCLGCHFAHVSRYHNFLDPKSGHIGLHFWPGYTNERCGEPIGIGRILNKDYLDKLEWNPFDPNLNVSMDWCMWQKRKSSQQKEFILPSKPNKINLLSISTDWWPNKHKFNEKGLDYINANIKLLEKNFYEIFHLRKQIRIYEKYNKSHL